MDSFEQEMEKMLSDPLENEDHENSKKRRYNENENMDYMSY